MKKKTSSHSSLRSFWDWTGDNLQPFFNAPSTRYYFECERALFEQYFSDLRGKKLFKTDLWDEAKNSLILKWAAEQGAEAYAIDISTPILNEARDIFRKDGMKGKFILSDARNIAFADNSFDFIYSMGTIEHFPEYRQAIKECYRTLKSGGKAIIGVPNLFDPFFRPLMVSFLNRLGLYAYGYEKSFSMKKLGQMLSETGFSIIDKTGILFMPGWLRMADLFVHIRWPRLSFLLAPLVAIFSFLYRKYSFLKRHGYLIACVVQKP
jgi:SAM-dependent methyltransferase